MVGSIKDLKDVNLLRNDMEFLLTSDGIGCVGIDTSLLPVVVLNGKAYQYTRQELIDFAYEQLTRDTYNADLPHATFKEYVKEQVK